ncbi:MAG: transcriptional regulator [Gammaproteobacteria bacterium]|nr:transcriptional regulator [Gammaproteobacteria bacterium]|tara:strand:- start:209 stop:475 length:267 start_codon:yes stop_codon:yes gene_type:complete
MHDHAYEQGSDVNSIIIGKMIKDTRQALGLRQDELASVAGLSIRSLSNIENGKNTAHLGLVLNTLNALGITITLSPPHGVAVREVRDA